MNVCYYNTPHMLTFPEHLEGRVRRPREDAPTELEKFAEISRVHKVATDVFKDVVIEDSIKWADHSLDKPGIMGRFKDDKELSENNKTPLYVTIEDGGTSYVWIKVFSDENSAMRLYGEDLAFDIRERDERVEAHLAMEDFSSLDLGSKSANALEVAIAIRDAFQAGR